MKLNDKQKVQKNNRALLPDSFMTIEQLKEIVGNNSFYFDYEEDRDCMISVPANRYVYWNTYRDETDEELADRVAKEEAYMTEYNKRKGIIK